MWSREDTRTLRRVETAVNRLASAVIFAALIGLGIVFAAGHLQAAALHGAAHDARHANGFPCH